MIFICFLILTIYYKPNDVFNYIKKVSSYKNDIIF